MHLRRLARHNRVPELALAVLCVTWSTFLTVATAASTSLAPEVVPPALLASYSANTLVSDSTFAASQSLSESQIQTFLQSKTGVLDTYVTKDINGVSRTAARIVADAAQAWAVSPKVLLSKLQCEQGLVSNPAPTQYALDWAMGCGVPDGGTLESFYKGFGKQVWYGAQSLHNGTGYWYSGISKICGDGVVYPTNPATYAMYRYTPWISSNQLFYNVFAGYFGDPTEGSVGVPSVYFRAPVQPSVAHTTRVPLEVTASNTTRVSFSAYYATDPADPSTIDWHYIGQDTDGSNGWGLDWNLTGVPDQGSVGLGTVNVVAKAWNAADDLTQTYTRIVLDRKPNRLKNASFELGALTGWSSVDAPSSRTVISASDTPNSPPKEGMEYLKVVSTDGGTLHQDVRTGIRDGDCYTYSVWVRSATGEPVTGRIALWNLGKDEGVKAPFTVEGTEWQLVSVALNPAKTGTTLRAELYFGGDSVFHIDGAQLQRSYLYNSSFERSAPDGWHELDGPFTTTVVNDETIAREGDRYLDITADADGGSFYQDIELTPQSGETWNFSTWMRSPTGTPCTGRIVLWALGGNTEGRKEEFSVPGDGQWHLVTIPLTVVGGGHSAMRAEIYLDGGVRYLLDGAQLQKSRMYNSSLELGATNGWKTTGTPSLSIGARDGNPDGKHFLQVSSPSGGSIYQDVAVVPSAGQCYTYGIWVRSGDGSPVSGSINIWALGGTQERAKTNFTVEGDEWEFVSAGLNTKYSGHSGLRPEIYLATGASYDFDGATLAPGNIAHTVDPPAGTNDSGDSTQVEVERLEGSTRYNTAVALSEDAFPDGAPAVVIATGENFPDALCAAPLARAYGGPILLTKGSVLLDSVAAELKRLGPEKVFIVGGTSAVSSAVQSSVASLLPSAKILRLAGETRYATAAEVADQLSLKLGGLDTAVIATGQNFPDALAAAPLAARKGWPILLVSQDSVPSVTAAAIKNAHITSTLVVGGTDVVSAGVASNLPAPIRKSGTTRYHTAAEIAEYAATQGLDFGCVGLATGTNFPDALAAGPYLGREGGMLMLVKKDSVPSPIATCLKAHKGEVHQIEAIGGADVVSDACVTQARGYVQ